ncbi:MAG: hypothetical protein HYY04_14385 [Chloroflexi bacterium]|nr:hypothetical protein [Chloroflexota bacterium]
MSEIHVPHRHPTLLRLTSAAVRRELLDRVLAPAATPLLLGVFAALAIIGVIGLALRVAGGYENRVAWGYTAALLAWLFMTVHGAPLAAAGLRFVKADWRRPIVRIVELCTVGGLVTFPLFLLLLPTLPPRQGRANIWFDWPGAPGAYEAVAVLFLALTGLAMLALSARPDFAAARDAATGAARRRYAFLAGGWRGTPREWDVLRRGLVLLGALYIFALAFVQFLYPIDFGLSLIPGWISAIFPAFAMLTTLQCAAASTLIALYLWRRFGGLSDYLRLDHFWGLAKILLATSLLWFYFWWADFLTLWYGRKPPELAVLQLLVVGPYFVPFALAFLLSFVVPFGSLIWNRVRISIAGPVVVALSVLLGNFFNTVRIYVAAYSVAGMGGHALEQVPPAHPPDVIDAMIVVGVIGLIALLYTIASRVIPPVSIWEVNEGLMLRRPAHYLKGEYIVVGKPT